MPSSKLPTLNQLLISAIDSYPISADIEPHGIEEKDLVKWFATARCGGEFQTHEKMG